MTAPHKHSRLWLYAPWGAFVVLAIAWCVYWFALAGQIERRIAHWSAAQEAAGGQAHIGHISRHGFPALMRFELDEVDVAPQGGAFRLRTDRIDLHVNLTDPRNLILERKAPFALAHGEAREMLDANTAVLSFRLGAHGLTYTGLEADRVTLDNPQTPGVFTLGHVVANSRPDPRNAADWQIALALSSAHLARPATAFEALGQDLPRVQAAIVWTPARRARIEGFEAQWGAAHADMQGDIGLDAAHRLDGRLNVATPRAALSLLPPAVRAAALARQPAQDPIAFTLDARAGALYADGHPVRDLAPLY